MRPLAAAFAIVLAPSLFSSALAQNCPAMRKINIGVAVAPPNVVHTAPYVAKALGFFSKHCVEANIIQFDGGAAGTSVTAVAQGSAISNLPDVAIGADNLAVLMPRGRVSMPDGPNLLCPHQRRVVDRLEYALQPGRTQRQ